MNPAVGGSPLVAKFNQSSKTFLAYQAPAVNEYKVMML